MSLYFIINLLFLIQYLVKLGDKLLESFRRIIFLLRKLIELELLDQLVKVLY